MLSIREDIGGIGPGRTRRAVPSDTRDGFIARGEFKEAVVERLANTETPVGRDRPDIAILAETH